jgi:hypothetical protein
MEHLTKQQIVLLTLLVSFVTSIATGIFTVTLMQQAPQSVTQTINRIVERTVEKVVPIETQKAQVVRQEVTTVIKEDDLVVDAVSKNEKSLVRIYGSVNGDPAEQFLGYGVVINDAGVTVTDRKVYAENATYKGIFYGNKKFPLELIRSVEGELVVYLKPTVPKDASETFNVARLADSNGIRLGQRIISLAGERNTTVQNGIVTALEREEVEQGTSTPRTEGKVIGIETSLPSRIDTFGSPIINLSAETIGLYIGFDGANGKSYLPINLIKIGVASTTPANIPARAPAVGGAQ